MPEKDIEDIRALSRITEDAEQKLGGPTAAEGLRLILAFLSIKDPELRQMAI